MIAKKQAQKCYCMQCHNFLKSNHFEKPVSNSMVNRSQVARFKKAITEQVQGST